MQLFNQMLVRAVSEQFQWSFRAVSEQFQSSFRAVSEWSENGRKEKISKWKISKWRRMNGAKERKDNNKKENENWRSPSLDGRTGSRRSRGQSQNQIPHPPRISLATGAHYAFIMRPYFFHLSERFQSGSRAVPEQYQSSSRAVPEQFQSNSRAVKNSRKE